MDCSRNSLVPTFQTARLILRPPMLEDAESWQTNFNDYDVLRFLSRDIPYPYPADGAADYLKNVVLPTQGADRWCWVLCLKNLSSEVIGAIDLWRQTSVSKPENRGFWLPKKHWSKGFMSEAVVPVMNYAFNDLGFEKLVFSNAVGNIASRRIKEKTGATFLRTAPAKFIDEAIKEHELWELKKEGWLNAESDRI